MAVCRLAFLRHPQQVGLLGVFVLVLLATPALGPVAALSSRSTAKAAAFSPSRVPLLDNEETWKRLPAAVEGAGKPLPVWARALARTLPRTTAAMLEFEYAQRGGNPLEPQLRSRLRWIVAHANRCRYSEAYAAADLRRAGLDEAGIDALAGEKEKYPEPHRAALLFARQLTEDASGVSDAQVARLIEDHGEKAVVAMALLVAYANFQDRLLLALDLPLEADGPLPPLDVRFERPAFGANRAGPVRANVEGPKRSAPPATTQLPDADWPTMDFNLVRKELDERRVRKPRIKLPSENAGAIQWGLVGRTYQPELADAWTRCAQAFGDEANQDPIFEQSLFWVVSRTGRCFY